MPLFKHFAGSQWYDVEPERLVQMDQQHSQTRVHFSQNKELISETHSDVTVEQESPPSYSDIVGHN